MKRRPGSQDDQNAAGSSKDKVAKDEQDTSSSMDVDQESKEPTTVKKATAVSQTSLGRKRDTTEAGITRAPTAAKSQAFEQKQENRQLYGHR